MLLALASLITFLENSIIDICRPKQIPKYGMLLVLAKFAANTFPSIPLSPKPPGTNMPLISLRVFIFFLLIFSESKYCISTVTPFIIPA